MERHSKNKYIGLRSWYWERSSFSSVQLNHGKTRRLDSILKGQLTCSLNFLHTLSNADFVCANIGTERFVIMKTRWSTDWVRCGGTLRRLNSKMLERNYRKAITLTDEHIGMLERGQTFINCDNLWQKDGKEANVMRIGLISHIA